MYKYSNLLDIILFSTIIFYLLISPYTKVEESFNIQATHDIINFGITPKDSILNNYDHINFPGVVPRSFIGSLAIGLIVKGIQNGLSFLGIDLIRSTSQIDLQILSRALLGISNAVGLIKVRNSANKIELTDQKEKSRGLLGFWFSVLLLTQFHLLYYASRSLPNFIALPIVLLGLSRLLEGEMSGLAYFSFTGIVFRLEVGLLGVIIAIVSSIFGQSEILVNFLMLTAGTLLGGFLTAVIDSYFWDTWLIPELISFKFNVVSGKSSEWGVEPWSAYFNKYLPQLLSPYTIPILIIIGLFSASTDIGTKLKGKTLVSHPAKNSLRILFIASIFFIMGMSFQPHKEWRFIIYVIPIIILQAANGLTIISYGWNMNLRNKLFLVMLVVITLLQIVLALFKGYASSYNYPGGNALQFVNNHIASNNQNEKVLVHMDVASCMSGISKFGELHNNLVTYDKTEDPDALQYIWDEIDIMITEEGGLDDTGEWELIHKSSIFKAVSFYPIIQFVQLQKRDSSTIVRLCVDLYHDLSKGDFSRIFKSFESFIVRDDYLCIYRRAK